jgi:hypothetical protein
MIRGTDRIRGEVTVTVRDPDGNIKRRKQNIVQRLLHILGRKMVYRHHNTVTTQGEGLLADWMLTAPTKPKVTNTAGYILIGTGWTGTAPKANTSCNKATGTYQKMNTGYPKTKAAFGAEGQNVVLYEATFAAGSLNADGINETALLNGNTATAQCLAYAQITPTVDVTSADSLTIDWEITMNGS